MAFFSDGLTKSKLMVLYFLRELSVEMTREQITTFSAAYELIPYFELQNAVYELEEEGFLAVVPRPHGQAYCITPKGAETISMFEERLPQSVRDDLINYADASREKLRRETQFSATREKAGAGGGYRATLRAMEKSGELLQISILLPDAETSKRACAAWPDRAQAIYAAILTELLGEG